MRILISEGQFRTIHEIGEFNPADDIPIKFERVSKTDFQASFEVEGIKYFFLAEFHYYFGLMSVGFSMVDDSEGFSNYDYSSTTGDFKGLFKKISVVLHLVEQAKQHFESIAGFYVYGIKFVPEEGSGVKRQKFFDWIVKKSQARFPVEYTMEFKAGFEDHVIHVLDYDEWIEHLKEHNHEIESYDDDEVAAWVVETIDEGALE